jgi:hypothetical protein
VLLLVAGFFALAAGAAVALGSAASTPTGERIVGGNDAHGGTVVEPAYDDMTGAIRYLSTPRGASDPVKSNPIAAAPLYLPVYPIGSAVATSFTLNCLDTTTTTTENCPDHGPGVAAAAQAIMPSVYGVGVAGHDHLMSGPASHGDFNVAWVPTLVLFTSKTAANQHLVTETQVEDAVDSGEAIEVPLDGTNGTPNLTFTCAVVTAAVYAQGAPFLG